MAIRWSKMYEIGVEEVDKQHKEFFKRSNRLMKACQNRKGMEEIEGALNFLTDYIEEHFEKEEKIQKKYNYPKYAGHKRLHSKFVKKVEDFNNKLDNQEVRLGDVIKINKTINRWFINHIRREDQKLGEYIKNLE